MKPLLVGWICDWASCEGLRKWILASWLVVSRRLPDHLRPNLGILDYECAQADPGFPHVCIDDSCPYFHSKELEEMEAPEIAQGEILETDDDDDIIEHENTQAEDINMDESMARALSLGLRARR